MIILIIIVLILIHKFYGISPIKLLKWGALTFFGMVLIGSLL